MKPAEREEGRRRQSAARARALGINHVALEVGDLDKALEFYGRIVDFELRGRSRRMAFIDLGDQFVALAERQGGLGSEGNRASGSDSGRTTSPRGDRHFGLVVDDKEAVRRTLVEAGADWGAKILPSSGLDFLDPWGNHVQVVQYSDIQFTKTPEILRGMGLAKLGKSPAALQELREKGLVP